MQYKTIALQLLEQQPELYEKLRQERQVIPAMEQYARELRMLHLAWTETLAQAAPNLDPSQIASEAMERAVKDLEERLSDGMPEEGQEVLSLDGAMAFIRRHTPQG